MKTAGAGTTVVIIGAGLGGMSAAIMLASSGFQVTVLEKNMHIGGKLNQLEAKGFRFDLGPSIFTLPQVFRPLFEGNGRRLEEFLPMERLDLQWRNFFEDGTTVDLWEDREKMRAELARFGPRAFEEYTEFLAYSRRQYEVIEKGYLRHGLDTLGQFLRHYGWKEARDLDYIRSMSGSIYKRVGNPYLRDIFEYFIKYVGSSALSAPAFMNLMPNIQMEYGLWYLSGGLYQLAHAFRRRLEETGVELRLGHEVVRINQAGSRVTGVHVRGPEGETRTIAADYVVSNMEVIPAVQKLLGAPTKLMKKLRRFQPSCSGIVVHLGLDRVYPQLAHHNFFFSTDLHSHFRRVFRDKRLPEDPTLYVVAPTRTDSSQAPPGCDNIKILPHIPAIDERRPYTHDDYVALKEICFDKLERMGLNDLRNHIVVEDFWTPLDIEARYASNRGSIYGVVCDQRSNFAFKAPKQCSEFHNLFFVGGSVNPGAGMPMVALSGQHVARMIAEQHERETMILPALLCALGLCAAILMAHRVPVCPKDAVCVPISISIIIPARNEEKNLPRLLASIANSAFRPTEVLVVDDASTDNTAAVAEQSGAIVIPSSSLPAGWTGKTWACCQGSQHAMGELLLFLDADTYFVDDGLENLVARWLREESPDVALSVLPYHAMQAAYEQLGLFFNTLMAVGAGGFSTAATSHLFGQSLLISAGTYHSVNGHSAVKGAILENLSLARVLHEAGIRTLCFGGRGTVQMRMFPDGLRQMADSWSKAFLRGAAVSGSFVLVCSVAWISLLWTVALLLIVSAGGARLWFLAVYLLLSFHLAWFTRQLGTYRILTCLLYPLPLAFFCGVFGRSAVQRSLGHKILWRGREV